MLRVMMLSTDLERGGLPLRLVRLADALTRLGVEPIVGCLKSPGPLSAKLRAIGIETFSCEARSAADVGCLRRLAEKIRHYRPDLLHAALFHANLAARLVGRLDRSRPIITSTVTIEIERQWHRWLEALTAERSDLHVANSESVARHLREELGFDPRRVLVIPNGLDVAEIDRTPPMDRAALGWDREVPLIVWAGRMDPVKDLGTFIAVIDELRRVRPVRALLLGDGPERPRVAAWIQAHGLESVITMALWSEDVVGWMKTADLMIFPSLSEGSPNAVLEAMLCGCPVVASDLPATRDLIRSGTHGRLCSPRNVRAFFEAARALLDRDAERSQISNSARRSVQQRHALPQVAGIWVQTYTSLLGGHQDAR